MVGEERTDISYGLVIGKRGTVYEGRRGGPYVQQAGAFGANSDGIHIALLGDFNHHHPTAQQLRSLQTVLSALCREFNLDPLGRYRPPHAVISTGFVPTICSHEGLVNENPGGLRDACPGVHLYDALPSIRNAVDVSLTGRSTPVGPAI